MRLLALLLLALPLHALDAVVLISANAEWKPTRAFYHPSRLTTQPYGEQFIQQIGRHRVLFLQGGWGKVDAAASAQYAIERYHPKLLLNLGTCGGIRERIHRFDTILVTRTIIYDIKEAMGDSQEAINDYSSTLDLTWLPADLPFPVLRLPLPSADRDGIPSEVPDLIAKYDAHAVDWESGAIAHIAQRHHQRLLILRQVSDLYGPDGGEAIGNLDTFTNAADKVMRDLLTKLPALLDVAIRK